MTTLREETEDVLEVARAVKREAEQNGHDMHGWATAPIGVGLFTTCRRCGDQLKVQHRRSVGVSVVGCNMSTCTNPDYHGGKR